VADRRIRLRFSGIVQGVGFRPFIYRLAVEHGLVGWVRNRHDGVVVEVEGPPDSLERFLADAEKKRPPRAEVTEITAEEIPTGVKGISDPPER